MHHITHIYGAYHFPPLPCGAVHMRNNTRKIHFYSSCSRSVIYKRFNLHVSLGADIAASSNAHSTHTPFGHVATTYLYFPLPSLPPVTTEVTEVVCPPAMRRCISPSPIEASSSPNASRFSTRRKQRNSCSREEQTPSTKKQKRTKKNQNKQSEHAIEKAFHSDFPLHLRSFVFSTSRKVEAAGCRLHTRSGKDGGHWLRAKV